MYNLSIRGVRTAFNPNVSNPKLTEIQANLDNNLKQINNRYPDKPYAKEAKQIISRLERQVGPLIYSQPENLVNFNFQVLNNFHADHRASVAEAEANCKVLATDQRLDPLTRKIHTSRVNQLRLIPGVVKPKITIGNERQMSTINGTLKSIDNDQTIPPAERAYKKAQFTSDLILDRVIILTEHS